MPKVVFDYDPNMNTFGGMLGRWSITVDGKQDMLAGYDACLKRAKELGATFRDIRYTDEARKHKPRR